MKHDFEGASIIVTGATGALGRLIGRRLQDSGAKLVLFGRDADRLAAVDDDIAVALGTWRTRKPARRPSQRRSPRAGASTAS